MADLGYLERIANLNGSDRLLLEIRRKHALHGRPNIFDRVVDHAVLADVHLLAVRQLHGPWRRPHMESNHQRV